MSVNKISIITICLNSAPTIRDTIESVITQLAEDDEYIIIDGGSTDGTLEIISEYSNSIEKIISEPDKGPADAFNKGILLTKREVIGIINSDDQLMSGTLSAVRSIPDELSPEIAFYGQTFIKHNNELRKMKIRRMPDCYSISFSHCALFVPASCYEKYGLFSTRFKIAVDIEYILRLKSSGVKFKYISDLKCLKRLGGVSQVNKMSAIYEYYYAASIHLSKSCAFFFLIVKVIWFWIRPSK
jgi:glycosyltransferase involved in cell wall biosynthesis